jgi:hypothetical protein
MARTPVVKSPLPAAFAVAGVTATVQASTGGSGAAGQSAVLTGNEIVIALNTDTGATHTVTVTSAPDAEGRTSDITADIVPVCVGTTPGVRVYQRFPLNGYLQTDGSLYFEANSALIKFIVLQLN